MNYITIEEYAEKYGIPKSNIFLMIVRKNIISKSNNGILYILDEAPKEDTPTEEAPQDTPQHDISHDNTTPYDTILKILIDENTALKEQITERDNTIKDFALRFADLAQQAQTITAQAQILHGKEISLLPDTATDSAETSPTKRGILSKIFGKKNKA